MRKISKRLLVATFSLLLIAAFCWWKPFYVVPILNYHSVNTIAFTDTPAVNPEVFARQMEFIRKNGYKVISLDEYIQKRLAGEKLINTVVITFDDGYDDNYTYAFPILKKYHFPATVFVVAKDINKPRFLKSGQIREMEKDGITFGSHTINHAYLPAVLEEEDLRSEIIDSKLLLEKETGKPVDYFCYPIGGFNDEAKALVKLAGYKAAFTTNRGRGKLNQDLYALKRVKLGQKNPPGIVLWLKLSGYYMAFQMDRNPY
jgi:peptidoglycan/xylan/chitin deacetylase (PgdA/CDA1 family)